MRPSWVLVVVLPLLVGLAPRRVEDLLPAYMKAYNTVFDRLKGVELSDTDWRIKRLGERGKVFLPVVADLRRRQGEISDLMVKAVLMKKQAVADNKPAVVEEATRLLIDGDARSQRVLVDLARLNEKLTAEGAPKVAPQPPRDPNARD